jgi:hypothetical protein
MDRYRIKRLGIFSVAKMNAAVLFVISLIISIPYGLLLIFFGTAFGGSLDTKTNVSITVVGILFMIAVPILYAITGFISGSIFALLYNIFASLVGGIEIELEKVF